MLGLPGRERVTAAFEEGSLGEAQRTGSQVYARLSALELSYEETVAHGRLKCLTATYWAPDKRNRTLQHMMPVAADLEDFLSSARMHGRNAQKICEQIAYRLAMEK